MIDDPYRDEELVELYDLDNRAGEDHAYYRALVAERVRAAGVDVTVEVTGTADRVPEDIGLAAYRIVQEALTNVLKHAGNARATVAVDLTDGVEIIVTDDGRGAAAHLSGSDGRGAGIAAAAVAAAAVAASRVPGAGAGIAGMAERATAAGGSLTAGPRPGGGFELHALMPLADR